MTRRDPAFEGYWQGLHLCLRHPLFEPFSDFVEFRRHAQNGCPPHLWAVVGSTGNVYVHPTRRGTPEEWAWVLAHCLLHLGLGHHREHAEPALWNLACDEVVASFMAQLRLGRPVSGYPPEPESGGDEEKRYALHVRARSLPGPHDLIFERGIAPVDFTATFATGLRQAARGAVGGRTDKQSPAQRARDWFVSSYPLLGSLAASFKIEERPQLCQALSISVAAVDEFMSTIYLNPAAPLSPEELRFVMAHELLHVGLRHGARCQGRDPWLWNVACDFVINGWLIDMKVGSEPSLGMLHDPELKGLSAEEIYDRIACEARRFRKLATLRGIGLGDMLGPRGEAHRGEPCSLDDFFRRCLAQGLVYHEEGCRGLLPADLIEEIHALSHPPLPWDVQLARWFDLHFQSPEQSRTYARLSRRQSASPDIPRPAWWQPPEEARTFGVLIDTSCSMPARILALGLGAVASYAESRQVPACRVVFCDAHPYDQGYMRPDTVAGRVEVRGRGGTILQPGIDLLERANDFPETAPLLVVTDGQCDRLNLKGRAHAFLMPAGATLPFPPRGEVFRILE